ncbi:inositol hexakisphosphate and diphosphoinositol-pentakisphosphate kinase 2 [Elysia marginata]|uniref:Inositol hexakisphosphate and diphosphoinositol-pentakisphosphate kinase 2 n=1 Tax=Elysia marginata TaxID=1093978 RepID=A0AAV4JSC4_9GAST|nr:inositol hexakisphosphate and diphosphoinositol-pentakisphosphate kinase 2 [Elysia marginata]
MAPTAGVFSKTIGKLTKSKRKIEIKKEGRERRKWNRGKGWKRSKEGAGGLHKPYKKPNDSITYIHRESNHPPSIIKNLPQGILEKRLTNNSSNEKIFEDAAKPYNEALKKSGHVIALKYAEKKTNTTTKNENKRKETANEETKETKTTNRRKRRITWFNPPMSKNVSSNIGKKFFDLLNSCFPPNHKLHKIINKNTVKLSYSCTPNIKQIISSHNKRIINESSNKASTTKLCNCRDKPSCPLQGKCLEQSLVYQATISETNTNKIDTYIGITENTFKTRFNQHCQASDYTTKGWPRLSANKFGN